MAGSIAITHAGIKEVEAALSAPAEPTPRFPPTRNVIRIEHAVNTVIQQGTVGSTQIARRDSAAGMTLDVPARYHGCAALAPVELELRAPFPPRGKAWVRVSTDRPVRLHLRTGERASAPVLTRPGKSALASWDLVR